jgi:chromosome segregation protein
MLKALDFFGFKSFADKTRFEFPPGITVIVGPNGSGKSNIVDAIKWVLGEQSAKSLRGKEMADVIFKGSGTVAGGRKPAGAAEATLVFDNADGRLPVEAPEVHITRRVYRSGEGEYLINRQPARLKDIKDMFRGTGVGVDAYSLIEQGKVDRLLQASAKDRRAIFEEAAGISRFKAKKIEAQRRLERVEQNLLRLSDIVEEVENRLRSVRNQAAKAKRYREYSDRLQQLRTQVALVDWRKLTARIEAHEQELAALRAQSADASAQGEALEASLLEVETAVLSCDEQIRAAEALAATNREQIAEREATIQQQQARLRELDEEAPLHRRNLAAMSDRAGDVKARLSATTNELAAAREVHGAISARLAEHEGQSLALAEQLESARREGAARRREHVSRLQAAAVLSNRIEAEGKQRAAAELTCQQCSEQLHALKTAADELEQSLAAARQKQQGIDEEVSQRQSALEDLSQDLAQTRRVHASRREDLALLQSRRRGLEERAALLEELDRSLEGLGAGVKDVLRKVKGGQTSGPLAKVRGVLADLIAVKVEHAAAIDIALGDAAQALVVEGTLADVEAAIAALSPLTGRVTFIASVEPEDGRVQSAECGMQNEETSALRADELVEMPAEFQHLAKRLLADTRVVAGRADALRLWRECGAQAGLRFVTLDGELLEAGGAISLGPRQSAIAIISRRSELRSLRSDLEVLVDQIAASQSEVAALREQIDVKDRELHELGDAVQKMVREAADVRVQTRTLEERSQQSSRQISGVDSALAEARSLADRLASSLNQCRSELAAAEAEAARQQAAIEADEVQQAQFERQRQAVLQEATAARVELARSEQRVEGLEARLTQFEDDQRERERAVHQVRQQLRQCEQRHAQAELLILQAESQTAAAYLRKEELVRDIAGQTAARETAALRRTGLSEEVQRVHKSLRQLQDQQHQVDLAAGQVRHERQTLVDRLREDYQIDLAELTAQQEHDPQLAEQRAEVELEIESLRRKIHQIGAVNLDALDELDELEARFAHLSSQHKDLTEAKQALERIIHKINADSRRLFTETLEAIRANFQTLYRKAFGGGKADIVLEEGVDVLDAGVEIIATPPGKPSFNNSLLSGGEKALTAVALLLAIFQFRPSPFCVLDEVDAPFDEANIGRFIDVLNEFLGWTKFIIVTHSKKTMTAATTLYGVTMQESGVSKRVSVRFDDVSDDGHIRQEAIDRQRREEPEEERGVA